MKLTSYDAIRTNAMNNYQSCQQIVIGRRNSVVIFLHLLFSMFSPFLSICSLAPRMWKCTLAFCVRISSQVLVRSVISRGPRICTSDDFTNAWPNSNNRRLGLKSAKLDMSRIAGTRDRRTTILVLTSLSRCSQWFKILQLDRAYIEW